MDINNKKKPYKNDTKKTLQLHKKHKKLKNYNSIRNNKIRLQKTPQ